MLETKTCRPGLCSLRGCSIPTGADLTVLSLHSFFWRHRADTITALLAVYALGIYVDAPAAKSTLSAFKKKPVEDLVKDQSFYDAPHQHCLPGSSAGCLPPHPFRACPHAYPPVHVVVPAVVAAPNVEKTLRLVISSRLVDRKKFLEALEERLAPRLKQAGEPGTLEEFRKQFDGVHFERGLEIAFTCPDNKKLVTKVGGQQKGTISSGALCSSLFDIYLGSDPVSNEAKTTFGKSLAASFHER
ncbi:hypothetical protein VOLCADRAFT_106123 [Volvox carteri f. nagariensis]|uniref:Chalcone isomerase domain-containing protein n=1 Tax=Volvox carteri f. nagariensis TaxID=3068 RepID=D8U586_VOLCA|nr:uncharacterized protein VOLCADRAFT_106123 [Volvox carteri f. nagariensis]EFJ45108.1 hypothetical protein VOLCADRAFT_106123 [Volvox carteri f. nagariensis]|eukprot:XP_002953784.1 hypothetical protein VOLCADRAFT_106123 [Volvox carteri f. nagariensis]